MEFNSSAMSSTTSDDSDNVMDILLGTNASRTTNSSDPSAVLPMLAERVFEAILLSAICVVAICGNTFLWMVVLRHRTLKTESNALVLCLSSADLLVSVISMPMTIVSIAKGQWVFNEQLCIALGFISMCTFIGSVMSLAAISINRYVLIVHPSKFKRVYTKRNTGFFIIGVWILSVLLASPPLTGQWAKYGYLSPQSFCFCKWQESDISYTYFMVGICFGGPCSVMTFCYFNILRVVRQSRKRVASNPVAMQRPRGDHPSSTPQTTVPSFSANGNISRQPTAESADSRPQSILDLSIDGQFNPRPSSAQSNRPHSADTTPIKRLTDRRSQPREIKWIFPNKKSSSMGNIEGDKNRTSNSASSNGATGRSRPNERSSLTRHVMPLDSPLKKQRKKNRSQSERRRKEEELKLTKSFAVVIFVFIICWLPFCVTMFWSVYSDRKNPVPRPLDMGTLLLGYLNSCCNPIIYGVMNKRFRAGYKNLFGGWTRRAVVTTNEAAQISGIHLNTSTVGSIS